MWPPKDRTGIQWSQVSHFSRRNNTLKAALDPQDFDVKEKAKHFSAQNYYTNMLALDIQLFEEMANHCKPPPAPSLPSASCSEVPFKKNGLIILCIPSTEGERSAFRVPAEKEAGSIRELATKGH